MRHDREKVFELRKNGKSYRQIQEVVNISRATLCNWFKNEDWSNHVKKSNIEQSIKTSRENLKRMNEIRSALLNKKYELVEEEAKREFEIYKNDTLFVAGLMLYAGEGDKATRGIIRLANIDFDLHKIFIRFVINFLGVDKKFLRCSILLYPDLNIEECKTRWSTELGLPISQFHKPQIIQGKHRINRLHFGVGSTIFSSSFLKRKLLLWIQLAKTSLSVKK